MLFYLLQAYKIPHVPYGPPYIITETQKKLTTEDVRTKRCLELSPSVAKPSAKVQATGGSRRRSLDFATAGAPVASFLGAF